MIYISALIIKVSMLLQKKNWYPLPLTNDLINHVQGCNKYTVIDLKNAFNLVCIKEGDKWKMAFQTHLGLFEYTVMPFGLTNAPTTFQSLIQDTLHNTLNIYCVVYLDDILFFFTQAKIIITWSN